MKISVLTTIYNPAAEHLEQCLRSVAGQTLHADRTHTLEHICVDDASSAAHVSQQLAAAADITVVSRATNGGIVAAANDALAAATGEWLVLLDHDDVLVANALERVVATVAANPVADVITSDHMLLRPDGRATEPALKPTFSPERLRATNYLTHLVCIRADLVRQLGGFTIGRDGAQDHDLLLRLVEHGANFVHIPEILVLWRQSPASVARDVDNKPTAFTNGLTAIEAHLARCNVTATVTAGAHTGTYRIDRPPPNEAVSVIIPTNGAIGRPWGRERIFVLEAIRSLTVGTETELEFVVVADTATPAATRQRLATAAPNVVIVDYDKPFNFSDKINRGVTAASHNLILILNDDTELVAAGSVERMASLIRSADSIGQHYGPVGAVGAKLLYPDGTLQHAGHLYHGEFMHACIGWAGNDPGPGRMLAIDRECAGVTAAALMTTTDIYHQVGGMPNDLPLHFNDVAFSLNVRAAGYRILYTPYASWYHFEGRTRTRGATMEEWRRVAKHWDDGVPHDPYANPNLVLKQSDWLENPELTGAPPSYIDDTGERRFG